jgi:acetylornithine deacetylase/succinyl-diaminopimelate desuccinylase-like protein
VDPLPLLRDLVAANSINPALVPGAPGEAAAAEVVRAALDKAGVDVTLQEAAPGRSNVIGVVEGREPGPSMMFCGHIDTVGVDGMSNPFDPYEQEGRLYGRGAQDMKSGVAAMIAAAVVLKANWKRGRLIVAAVVDEEHMSVGAEALVREWKADMAVVTEPTDLVVAVGHKGFAWADIVTHGRAAHGSRPAEGRDAIAMMGRVLVALEARDRELRSMRPVPFQGCGSLHASIIKGGHELSSYPDYCKLEMERRTVSGEDAETVSRELGHILERLRQQDSVFRATHNVTAYRAAYSLDPAHPLPAALSHALSASGRSGDPGGMSFWTDAAILAGAGIPSVLFGPGGAGLHSIEEYVNVADVVACRDILVSATTELVAR